MESPDLKYKSSRKIDWFISLGIALVSCLFYSLATVNCAAAGIEANVLVNWLGLDSQTYNQFALAGFFVKMVGFSSLFASLTGALAILCVYHLVTFFLHLSFGQYSLESQKILTSRIGAISASVIFAFTPCVFDSSTHIGPALFDALWAMLAIVVLILCVKVQKKLLWLFPLLSGVLISIGVADTVAFLLLVPFCGVLTWILAQKSGGRGYIACGFFVLGLLIAFPFAISIIGNFNEFVGAQKALFKEEFSNPMSFGALILAVVLFLASLFSSATVFSSGKISGFITKIFYFIMSGFAVFAVSSSFSVSKNLGVSGYQPVFIAALVASMVGFLIAYWWALAHMTVMTEHNNSEELAKACSSQIKIGRVAGLSLSLIIVLVMVINLVVDVDLNGVKALEEISRNVVSSMGGRTWIVTDGVIDDGVRIAASRQRVKLHIVSLVREKDKSYLENLAKIVLEEKLGGEKLSKELAEILVKDNGVERQRLLPFIEHWFRNDPEVSKKVVVWGAPHLWMNVEKGSLPELYFFTCEEPSRKIGDWLAYWSSVKDILSVPEGWGSYRLGMFKDKAKKEVVFSREYNRRNLRRHIGLLATCQGNYHHFNGLKFFEDGKAVEAQAEFEKAFSLYELVLNEIDPDNLAALINEELLASKNGFKKALDKHKVIKQALEVVYKDPSRRYDPVQLSLLYGTVCDPNFMFSYGQALISRRGQYAHGVFQIRRAIDLIPAEQRRLAELNILAHYFSEGSEAHKLKARNIYLDELKSDPGNKMALFRLSNLEALDGNIAKAQEYLERALKGVEADINYAKQVAQLCLLKNDLRGAENALRKAIDSNPKDIHAWSLLTHVLIRDIDNMGEVKPGTKRAERKDALFNEIESDILPAIEAIAKESLSVDNDVVYRSTKALFLIRKGGVDNIRTARDSFDEVSKTQRVSSRTGDMILSLDMQLNDKEHALEKAKNILSANPSDPMANYIMGSLCLQNGDNVTAEQHLRKATTGKRTVPLAYNDLAEVLRRRGAFEEAEKVAREAVAIMPKLYVAWETLGSILMGAGKSFEEAEKYIEKACELSKDEQGGAADVRMLISLARVQIKRGQMLRAKGTMRVVQSRMKELTEYERKEFEELMKSVK